MPARARREGDYTATQVAEFLRCSRSTIINLMRAGDLAHYRLPPARHDDLRRYRVTRDELLKWLLAHPDYDWAIPAVVADRPNDPYRKGCR